MGWRSLLFDTSFGSSDDQGHNTAPATLFQWLFYTFLGSQDEHFLSFKIVRDIYQRAWFYVHSFFTHLLCHEVIRNIPQRVPMYLLSLQHHTFLASKDDQGHTPVRMALCALPHCISLVSWDGLEFLLSILKHLETGTYLFRPLRLGEIKIRSEVVIFVSDSHKPIIWYQQLSVTSTNSSRFLTYTNASHDRDARRWVKAPH